MNTPILDEFIEELEEFKEDNILSKELEKRLIEFKKIKEAINFTGSSTELKEKEKPSLDSWLKANRYELYINGYKKGLQHFSEGEVINKYTDYLQSL